ncbi:hypothetical protein ACWEQG_33180 [Microbispora sp. NPDC004025]
MEHATWARPEAAFEQADRRAPLGQAALAPRQALIVRLRFGLDGTAEQTRRQIAETVGFHTSG